MIKTVVNGRILDWKEDKSWPSQLRYTAEADVKVTLDDNILAFWGGPKKVKVKASCQDWSDSWEHLPWAVYFVELEEFGHVFDLEELISTGAVPPFDRSLKVKTGAKAVDVKPMQAPLNKRNMPATGQTAAGDVGLMPANYIRYLLTKDDELFYWMKAYSKGAASIGWHWDPFPKRGLNSKERRDPTGNGWKVNTAHQPAFHYLPYLITGDRIYLDLLHHQTNSNLWSKDGHILQGQVRSTAWKLRNLANTVFITPDDHPLKDYFQSHWEKVIRDWPDMNMFRVGETEGFHWRAMSREPGNMSPWMEDYLILSLCCADSMGLGVRDILEWKSNYTIKRHLSHPGYDPSTGFYRHTVGDPRTNKPVFGKTWGQVKTTGNPRWHRAGHYGDLSVAAITYLANRLGTKEAKLATDIAMSRLVKGGGADQRGSNPKWAIAPQDEVVKPPVKPPVQPPTKPPTKPTGIKKAAVVEIAGQFMEDVINLPDPVSEETLEDLADGLAEQLDSLEPLETAVDQIEKALSVNFLQTALNDVNALPETVVDGTVGIDRAETLSIVAAAEAGIVAQPILSEDPPPTGDWVNLLEGDLIFGEVEGQTPVGGGTMHPIVAMGRLDPTKRFMNRPGGLLLKTPGFNWPAFTLEFDKFLLQIRESTFVSFTLDENGTRTGPYFDWEFGGELSTLGEGRDQYANHLRINSTIDETNPASRGGLAGQWSRWTLVSDGTNTRVHINGEPSEYVHPYNGGLVSDALCAVQFELTEKRSKWQASHQDNRSCMANLRIKSGVDDEATIRARYNASYTGLANHIRGNLPGVTLPKQTTIDNQWAEIQAGDDYWTPIVDPLVNIPAW